MVAAAQRYLYGSGRIHSLGVRDVQKVNGLGLELGEGGQTEGDILHYYDLPLTDIQLVHHLLCVCVCVYCNYPAMPYQLAMDMFKSKLDGISKCTAPSTRLYMETSQC